MKKISLIFIVLFTINTPYLKAQFADQDYSNRRTTSALFVLDEYIKRQDNGVNYKDTKSYKGTPYNNPSFLSGNIYESNKLLATDVALRYNAIADEIEVKETLTTSDDEAKVLSKSLDIFVKINKDIFIFAPYQGGIENGGYFQVLFEGENYNLYKKLKKKFTPEKKATTSITTSIPATFTDKPVYYIVTKEGKYYELPESKNKKLKVFGNKQDEIKKYVKENKLNLKEEKDLLRVMRYFDNFENAKS